MKRRSAICVRWYPTFVPVFMGVWFFILFSIVYRAHFPYKHVSLQRRISETFVFDIEYDSTKHSENTVFHPEPWNYDYDSDDELLTIPSPLKVTSTRTYSVSTSAKITASSSTERSSALPAKEPTALTTKFQGRTFQKMVTPEIYDPKFTDEFDHGVSRDILDLLPGRTHILDMSIPEKDVKYNAGRIFHQLNHVSIKYNSANVKVVYLSGKQGFWHHPPGMAAFEQCRVKACKITYDAKHGPDADAVVFSNPGQLPRKPPFPRKSPNQVWAVSMIECPMNSRPLKKYNGLFNWTMTYRTDSVIETPYFKYQKSKDVYTKTNITTNYANGKTKKVAWLVSNCMMTRSGRMAYAKRLAKSIEVDIYGACGTKRCPQIQDDKCMRMLETDYKFYLAFENTKCLDYVTEKAVKALKNKVIPIVLGAPKATYQSILPSGSFIHVEDFRSPEELAQYLHKLDKNDTLYNEYFRWREEGEFIETKPWCRLCGLLHEPLLAPVWYNDIEQWWRPKEVCIGKSDWADKLS